MPVCLSTHQDAYRQDSRYKCRTLCTTCLLGSIRGWYTILETLGNWLFGENLGLSAHPSELEFSYLENTRMQIAEHSRRKLDHVWLRILPWYRRVTCWSWTWQAYLSLPWVIDFHTVGLVSLLVCTQINSFVTCTIVSLAVLSSWRNSQYDARKRIGLTAEWWIP